MFSAARATRTWHPFGQLSIFGIRPRDNHFGHDLIWTRCWNGGVDNLDPRAFVDYGFFHGRKEV